MAIGGVGDLVPMKLTVGSVQEHDQQPPTRSGFEKFFIVGPLGYKGFTIYQPINLSVMAFK